MEESRPSFLVVIVVVVVIVGFSDFRNTNKILNPSKACLKEQAKYDAFLLLRRMTHLVFVEDRTDYS
jgi:hypothetical protein